MRIARESALRRLRTLRRRGAALFAGVCLTAVIPSCGPNASTPLRPTAPAKPLAVDVTCLMAGDSALIGESFVCSAVARFDSGRTNLVGALPDCLWTTSDPSVVGVHPISKGGVFVGAGGGTAEVTASYLGVVGSTRVVVDARDGIKVVAWTSSTLKAGGVGQLHQEVCHSLVSASSGRVIVRALDSGRTLGQYSQDITTGGACEWRFLAFDVPSDADRICRTVSLEFGSQRIDALAPPNAGDSWCLAVTK